MGECLITRRGGESYELPVLSGSYPADVTVVQAADASASFSVQISTPGKPAEYTYQWYFNGAAVSGATGASYTQTGLTAAWSHTLYCAVTNKAGTVTSRVATLTVASAIPTFAFTGSSQVFDDGNYNWRIKLLTSGTLTFTGLGNATGGIDAFLVGGGGGASVNPGAHGGGGGGRTTTAKSFAVSVYTPYSIIIGAGGAAGASGGSSAAFSSAAAGGDTGGVTGHDRSGGNGGSGGGSGAASPAVGGAGGADGGNGATVGTYPGGIGQGTTTRAFGEAYGELYAGGGGGYGPGGGIGAGGSGGGGSGASPTGVANTGGGGSTANGTGTSYPGGSGIIIIRNRR